MKGLLAFSRLVDRFSGGIGVVCEYLVLLVCLISAGNAMMRYLINYSSNAYLEIQWHLFGVVVLLGAAYTFKRNEHVRVDVLYALLGDTGRLIVDIVGIVAFLIPMTVFMTLYSWPFFVTSFVGKELSTNAGGLYLWPAKLLLPAGFFLLFVQALSELIKRVAALRGDITLDTKYEKPVQ